MAPATTTSASDAIHALLDDFRRARPLRAGSLIITVFGDVIAPRGGSIWLASLIGLLERFGVNPRQVRTSVYRLVRDGWLTSEPIGRQSVYRLAPEGQRRIAQASARIYHDRATDWDGRATQVVLPRATSQDRDALRRTLSWLGFGTFGTNAWLHPDPDRDALDRGLTDLALQDRVVVFDAVLAPDAPPNALRTLTREAWPLEAIAARYAHLIERFDPIRTALGRSPASCADDDALTLRILLIHEYRKALLRDPKLPSALLPSAWIGQRTFELTREIYAVIRDASERAIDAQLTTDGGVLPDPTAALHERFTRDCA